MICIFLGPRGERSSYETVGGEVAAAASMSASVSPGYLGGYHTGIVLVSAEYCVDSGSGDQK